MRYFLFLLMISFVGSTSKAQPPKITAPTAEEVVKTALTAAAKENKNVLLMFHASWCGWCHRMDTSLNDPVCKKFFDDNFVITHLVVDESDDKKNLENRGGNEVRKKYHGDGG